MLRSGSVWTGCSDWGIPLHSERQVIVYYWTFKPSKNKDDETILVFSAETVEFNKEDLRVMIFITICLIPAAVPLLSFSPISIQRHLSLIRWHHSPTRLHLIWIRSLQQWRDTGSSPSSFKGPFLWSSAPKSIHQNINTVMQRFFSVHLYFGCVLIERSVNHIQLQ